MKWIYKNYEIYITNLGKFVFKHQGTTRCCETLKSAKELIDKYTEKKILISKAELLKDLEALDMIVRRGTYCDVKSWVRIVTKKYSKIN